MSPMHKTSPTHERRAEESDPGLRALRNVAAFLAVALPLMDLGVSGYIWREHARSWTPGTLASVLVALNVGFVGYGAFMIWFFARAMAAARKRVAAAQVVGR